MKKLTLIMSFVAMVFGFSSVSFASECTVKNGDSIWRIAERYKIPFNDLMELNRHLKNPHLIYPLDKIDLPNNSEQVTDHGSTSQAEAVLQLVNKERKNNGLSPLTLSTTLTNIATTKSKDMADNGYFSHTSPTYGSPFQMLQDFGVTYTAAGENIAAGQKSPEEVMQAWLNSSGHRANILNKNFDTIGIGYYEGGSYGVYWTQLFTGGK